MKTLNRTLLALALASATLTAIAQNEERPQPPGGPNGGRPRMASPLMEALDTNHDGTLDASEIKNATAARLKGGRGPGGPGGPEGQNREGRPRGEGRPPRPDKE
jgi:hypothetical protein